MVKGTKRSIPIKKIEEKSSRATCLTKRRDGLYSKSADLCLLSDSQIAVLATPSSSTAFFSFGHSSVDAVVAAFLSGKRPVPAPFHREDVGICLRRKDLGLGFWWDDERFDKSEDPEELRAAMDSMSALLKNLKEFRSGEAMDYQIDDHHHQAVFGNDDYETKKKDGIQELDHQTLDSQSICVISDNYNQDFIIDDMMKSEFDSDHGTQEEVDDQTLNIQSTSDDYLDKDGEIIAAISQNFCNNQEVALDQLIDFDTLWFDDDIDEFKLEDFSSYDPDF